MRLIRCGITTVERRLVRTSPSSAVTIARRYHSRQERPSMWVPEAYRGARSEPRAKQGRRPKGRGGERYSRRVAPKQLSAGRRAGNIAKERAALQEKEDRLMGLHKDFVRLARDYREVFRGETLALEEIKGSLRRKESERPNEEKKKVLGLMTSQMLKLLDDIHQADVPVDGGQILQTEDYYRGLCRVLQDIAALSVRLSKYSDNLDVAEFVELAEQSLRSLVKLGSDRKLLVESTNKWSSKTHPRGASPPPAGEDTSPRRSGGIRGWFNSILDGFPHEDEAAGSADDDTAIVDMSMAHEDPELGPAQNLVREVMGSIAATVSPGELDSSTTDFKAHHGEREGKPAVEVDRSAAEATATRMVGLLNLMPSALVPEAETVKYVLEMLCRAGTLESARECSLLYQRHPANQYRLRFSLVLQAYLEAAKHEKDREKLETIVHEAMSALHSLWHESSPSHRVERILHCSIVLNCMCEAQVAAVPHMCEAADRLIKRALGGSVYNQLQEEILSEEARVDTQVLPLIDCLAQLYASEGSETRLEDAKRMLNYMMQHGKDGVGRFIAFPNVGTFNAVLAGIVGRYEDKTGSPSETEASQKDLKYAISLLDYMLECSESGCWPNEETFVLLFRLLSAVNPEDVGERAENLLGKMEARRSFSRSNSIEIDLLAYHRVFRCWQLAAKSSSSSFGACERAVLRLMERLEIQSMPLLLGNQKSQRGTVRALYDTNLRPSPETYLLALEIFAEAKDPAEQERAGDVIYDIYRRMLVRSLPPYNKTASILSRCCTFLPEGSEKRAELESWLKSLSDDEGADLQQQTA